MSTTPVNVMDLGAEALDWAVANKKGLPIKFDPMGFKSGSEACFWIWSDEPKGFMLKIGGAYSPSTDWVIGGKIIEEESISLSKNEDSLWVATTPNGFSSTSESPLISVMKAFLGADSDGMVTVPNYFV